MIFDAVVEAAYLVAAADGTVDSRELDLLKEAVQTISDPELADESLDELLADLADLRSAEGVSARCAAVGQTLLACEAVDEGLYLAASMAYVSQAIARSELGVLEKIAAAAHVSGAQVATIAASARDEVGRMSLLPGG